MVKLLYFFLGVLCTSLMVLSFVSWRTVKNPQKPPMHFKIFHPNSSGNHGLNMTKDSKIVIGTVICGKDSYIHDGLVLIKSAIVSSEYHGVPTLHFVILVERSFMYELNRKVQGFQNQTKTLNFSYEILPIVSNATEREWNARFKFRCYTPRLFLHNSLPHINEILYLDADTLIVGDLREVWSKFGDMNEKQFMGIVREEEASLVGVGRNWYRRKATHPFFPPLGLNDGVLLMNLTRLRNQSILNWDDALLKAYKRYSDNMVLFDQDMINVVFSERPDALLVLPCTFNYRSDHCVYGNHCKAADDPKGKGVQILHGNSQTFHLSKDLPRATRRLTSLHEYFQKFDTKSGDYIRDIVIPFKTTMVQMHEACEMLVNVVFKFHVL